MKIASPINMPEMMEWKLVINEYYGATETGVAVFHTSNDEPRRGDFGSRHGGFAT